jgi:NAD(P)H-hydrate epimerase
VSYSGAAALAVQGALRAGAGLVTLAAIDAVRGAVAAQVPEVTHLPLPEEGGPVAGGAGDVIARALPRFDVLLIGPGLGQSEGVRAVVRGVLTAPGCEGLPVVIDADALNALSRWRCWSSEVKARGVLTPHPGELSRLTGESIGVLQADRLGAARRWAAAWGQTLVLKGAHTVVAAPGGRALVSPFATAALATAGTGDVLAGAIAGLLAQGADPFTAAGLEVYLHGAAAEAFRDALGDSGLVAGDLPVALGRAAAALRG